MNHDTSIHHVTKTMHIKMHFTTPKVRRIYNKLEDTEPSEPLQSSAVYIKVQTQHFSPASSKFFVFCHAEHRPVAYA